MLSKFLSEGAKLARLRIRLNNLKEDKIRMPEDYLISSSNSKNIEKITKDIEKIAANIRNHLIKLNGLIQDLHNIREKSLQQEQELEQLQMIREWLIDIVDNSSNVEFAKFIQANFQHNKSATAILSSSEKEDALSVIKIKVAEDAAKAQDKNFYESYEKFVNKLNEKYFDAQAFMDMIVYLEDHSHPGSDFLWEHVSKHLQKQGMNLFPTSSSDATVIEKIQRKNLSTKTLNIVANILNIKMAEQELIAQLGSEGVRMLGADNMKKLSILKSYGLSINKQDAVWLKENKGKIKDLLNQIQLEVIQKNPKKISNIIRGIRKSYANGHSKYWFKLINLIKSKLFSNKNERATRVLVRQFSSRQTKVKPLASPKKQSRKVTIK